MQPNWEAAFLGAVVALSTGCRGGEIRQLRTGDVVLDSGHPSIRIRRDSTKSDAGAREIPLNQIATEALRRLLDRARHLGAANTEDYLFPLDRSKRTRADRSVAGSTGYDP